MTFIDPRTPSLLLVAAMLTACGGGGGDKDISDASQSGNDTPTTGTDDPVDSNGITTRTLPVATDTVYLNLETGESVESSEDWHVSANRLAFKLNSGASGNGSVGGALAVAQEDFYENGQPDFNVFSNANQNSEEEHLLGQFSEPGEWQQDGFSSAFGESANWSIYGAGGVISEKPDVAYLVRSAEGDSYARMRVVDFNFPTRAGNGIEGFRFEFEVQGAGEAVFSGTTIAFEPPAGFNGMEACYNFDADAVEDCTTSTTWDVQVGFSGRNWFLKSNSGVSGNGNGGASDPMTWDEAGALDADPGVPQLYTIDSTGGVFSEHSWYEYNLNGGHKIWPNFRTYLIKADVDDPASKVWALQIVNYYNESGNSGNPTVRWLPVTAE